jgi:hypothetical protein
VKLTLEEEIQIVQDTRGLPTGQRCMRLGYPEITLAILEQRFAVHKLAEAQNKQEEERVFRELGDRVGINLTEARQRFRLGSDGGVIDQGQRERMLRNLMGRNDPDSIAALFRADEESLWEQLSNRNETAMQVQAREMARRKEAMRQEARRDMTDAIRFNMIGNAMPARLGAVGSFDGIKYKKVTGFVKIMNLDEYMEEVIPERVLDSIQVAREAGLQTFKVAFPCLKVDDLETKQFDPVVFAELGKRWLEIDMWE